MLQLDVVACSALECAVLELLVASCTEGCGSECQEERLCTAGVAARWEELLGPGVTSDGTIQWIRGGLAVADSQGLRSEEVLGSKLWKRHGLGYGKDRFACMNLQSSGSLAEYAAEGSELEGQPGRDATEHPLPEHEPGEGRRDSCVPLCRVRKRTFLLHACASREWVRRRHGAWIGGVDRSILKGEDTDVVRPRAPAD